MTKGFESEADFERIVKRAHPIDYEDWGSEAQVEAENRVYGILEAILPDEELVRYGEWASKATVDECMDRALQLYRKYVR